MATTFGTISGGGRRLVRIYITHIFHRLLDLNFEQSNFYGLLAALSKWQCFTPSEPQSVRFSRKQISTNIVKFGAFPETAFALRVSNLVATVMALACQHLPPPGLPVARVVKPGYISGKA